MRARSNGGSRVFILLSICLGLSFLIFRQAEVGLPLPDLSPAARPASPASVASAAAGPASLDLPRLEPIGAFAEVVERPVFFQTRRPPDPEAEPPPQAEAAPKADFVLSGLILSGKERLALLRPVRSATVERVHEGEEIEGWLVQAVKADRVVLKRGETVQEIRLEDKPPPPKPKSRRTRSRKPGGVPAPGDLRPRAPDRIQ